MLAQYCAYCHCLILCIHMFCFQQQVLQGLYDVTILSHALCLALQEIQAVDRVFPALDQVEMQLACKQVLDPVLSASGPDSPMPSAEPLEMAPSLTVASNAREEGNVNAALSNSSQGQEHQPEWLQERGELDGWILQNLNDGQRRLKMVKALTKLALPFRYGASNIMQALGDLYFENVS